MLRAIGIIHFDGARTAMLRRERVDHLVYHVTRPLTGEATAASEWTHLGLMIEMAPDTDGGPER